MSLSDTAEYWQDIKSNKNKHIFTHIKKIDCGHFHISSSDELKYIDCYACIKILENDKELKFKLEKNNGKLELDRRSKKGFKFTSIIKFGKHKGQSIQFIIDTDINYFNWLKNKIITHPELDCIV